jgi:Esterase PHB depolymerase
MKSENWMRMQAASSAGVCLAMLFMTYGAWAQETKETVTVNDVDRTYLVRLPRGYDHAQKYPVVILLHGMNQDTDDMERLTQFDPLADKDGIIAVYPSALHGRWNVGVSPPAQQPMTRSPGGRGGRHGVEEGIRGEDIRAEGDIPVEAGDIRAEGNREDRGAVKKTDLHRRMTLSS